MKKSLQNVTLVAVSGLEVEAHVTALEYSCKDINFAKVLLIAPQNPYPEKASYEYIHTNGFSDVGEWGRFICFELHKYITTDHIILIHSDGFIVNPSAWDDRFLDYDYIGAPWPLSKIKGHFVDSNGVPTRVGNSVSLRSLRLLKAPSILNLKWGSEEQLGHFNDDGFLCAHNKNRLESEGIRFAPLELACIFSREEPLPENKGLEPFAFHKWKGENKNYPRFTEKDRTYLIFIRSIRKIFNVVSDNLFGAR
jgi:hypothetical protein